jgi:hypothetical protein
MLQSFDGWYSDKQDALAVAQQWVARHPQWIVALVQTELVWFGNGDFTSIKNRPLTGREKNIITGETCWRGRYRLSSSD